MESDRYKLTYKYDDYDEEDPIFKLSPDVGIYIVKCDKYYKIGITQRIGSRMSGFSVNNPFPCELIFFTKVRSAKKMENSLHKILKKYHHKGEWFNLSASKVKDLIKLINKNSNE